MAHESPLAEHFLAAKSGDQPPARGVSPRALQELSNRDWYGNVRELRNGIEHAMTLARSGPIEPEHLPVPVSRPATSNSADSCIEDSIASLVARWTEMQLDDQVVSGDLYQQFLRLVEPPLLDTILSKSLDQCAASSRLLSPYDTAKKTRGTRSQIRVAYLTGCAG